MLTTSYGDWHDMSVTIKLIASLTLYFNIVNHDLTVTEFSTPISQADNLNSTLDTTNGDKDTGGDEEEVKSNPLAILPGTLYVLITNEGGSSLRIKVCNL